MTYKFIFVTLTFFSCLFFSCKQNQKVDPILQEALVIQDEAIHIGIEVDSLIEAMIKNDSTFLLVDKIAEYKKNYLNWKYNMVKIPGLEHDHDHGDHGHDHDHGDHDHGDHDHDHSDQNVASHLKPEEMKQVQIEWKNAILAQRDVMMQK